MAADRYLAEDCRVAAAWSTLLTVTTGATRGEGGTVSLLAASYCKSAIACYVATLAASFPCPMWVVYIL